MLNPVLTLFALIVMSLFIYERILNLNHLSGLHRVFGFVFAGILAHSVFLLESPFPYARFVFMGLSMGIFVSGMARIRFDLSLTGSLISLGISNGFFLISAWMISTAAVVMSRMIAQPVIDGMWLTFFSFLLQIAWVKLLFRIRRFQKGILFLRKHFASAAGLAISGLILLIFILFYNYNVPNELMPLLLICVPLCLLGLIFWWLNGLVTLYRQRIRERDLRNCESAAAEKDRQIRQWEESYAILAALAHRDNKLLYAMYEAVHEFVTRYDGPIQAGVWRDGRRLMNGIEQLMGERARAIAQSRRENESLPVTNDPVMDGLIRHIHTMAAEKEVQFDVVFLCDVPDMTSAVIPSLELGTLCADLMENAVIAASHSEYKKVLVLFGRGAGCYEITVQDTGIPFDIETLTALGRRPVTTHADEGGSGVGYMAIFDILRQFQISLSVTEYAPSPYGFTKSVKLRFDGEGKYRVHTYRPGEFPAQAFDPDGWELGAKTPP